jgi:hypothetical protein
MYFSSYPHTLVAYEFGDVKPTNHFLNGTARFRKFGCTRTAFGVQPANSVAGTIYIHVVVVVVSRFIFTQSSCVISFSINGGVFPLNSGVVSINSSNIFFRRLRNAVLRASYPSLLTSSYFSEHCINPEILIF